MDRIAFGLMRWVSDVYHSRQSAKKISHKINSFQPTLDPAHQPHANDQTEERTMSAQRSAIRRYPVSEKRLAANRANAKRSTGPRTESGRSMVSLNAVRHGLAGRAAVLPHEDLAAHAAFCHQLIAEFAPANAIERTLAEAIANDLWRLNRAGAIENNMLAVGQLEDDPDPDHDPAMQDALASARTYVNHADKFGLLTLYEQRINRIVQKNREELRRLQNERRHARRLQLEQMILEAAAAPPQITGSKETTASNGFVYASEVFADRQSPEARADAAYDAESLPDAAGCHQPGADGARTASASAVSDTRMSDLCQSER
jgi:hypothetical protein